MLAIAPQKLPTLEGKEIVLVSRRPWRQVVGRSNKDLDRAIIIGFRSFERD